MNRLNKKGFTIVELLVVVAIIALLISILLPAIGRARDAALVTQSLGNLRNLSAACNAYGADYNDRQFTAVPDEIGMYGDYCQGACQAFVAQQCFPGMALGWSASGRLWGYWIKGGLPRCSNYGPTCANNMVTYVACDYWGTCGSSGSGQVRFLGSWRLTNCKAFNNYLNGRFYDKVFYAPKDTFTLSIVEQYFSVPAEFDVNEAGDYAESTYCFSPAAMWAHEVLSWQRKTGAGATASIGAAPRLGGASPMPGAFKSPTASASQYPSLKWRMWEHQWLQNKEGGDINMVFQDPTPWFYNLGYNSAPAAMFFDGHVQIVSIAGIQQDNDLAYSQAQAPLYFNNGGAINAYYANASYDNLTKGAGAVTAGILTVEGILGRDMLRIGD
jgi:prepilin-type N-terminal cleavage/methylation domain-containing protein